MKQTGLIHMLDVDMLHPHKDNPRKDLGDLDELIKSIKKNGVMQNLTVVADDENYTSYTVLIGHRRLEAAKKAWVQKVPCVIAEGLSQKEQIAIMLEENMQRSDLTVAEQAESFQMMMELGETIESLTEKTGFSESTIRHRVKMAELDTDILKEKDADNEFQYRLVDLYELEKVEDLEEKNRILKEADDGADIKFGVSQYLRRKIANETEAACIKILEEKGVQRAPDSVNPWDSGYTTVISMPLAAGEETVKSVQEEEVSESPEEYIYLTQYGTLYIRKKETKDQAESEEMSAERKRQKAISASRKQLRALQQSMQNRRKDFIMNVMPEVKLTEQDKIDIVEKSIRAQLETTNGSEMSMRNLNKYLHGEDEWDVSEEIKERIRKMDTWLIMLALLDREVSTVNLGKYMETTHHNGTFNERTAEEINMLNDILYPYGWSLEEEEQQLLDGTHEAYMKEEDIA